MKLVRSVLNHVLLESLLGIQMWFAFQMEDGLNIDDPAIFQIEMVEHLKEKFPVLHENSAQLHVND